MLYIHIYIYEIYNALHSRGWLKSMLASHNTAERNSIFPETEGEKFHQYDLKVTKETVQLIQVSVYHSLYCAVLTGNRLG